MGFGNFFENTQTSKVDNYAYTGSFNVSDTGNTSISTPTNNENVGNSTVNVGVKSDIAEIMQYALPIFALVLLVLAWRGGGD